VSTVHKVVDHRTGARCGCEYTVDSRGREEVTRMCQEHETEHITRHAAAVLSCSHVNRDLVGEEA
jgi:hypothetical protein